MELNKRHQLAVQALIDSPTVTDASRKSGISVPTIYRYLKDPQFKQHYEDSRRALHKTLHTRLAKHSHRAIEALVEVIENPSAKEYNKITASKALLDLCLKANEQAELNALSDRLSEIESNRVHNI